jgi:hypothetical protein
MDHEHRTRKLKTHACCSPNTHAREPRFEQLQDAVLADPCCVTCGGTVEYDDEVADVRLFGLHLACRIRIRPRYRCTGDCAHAHVDGVAEWTEFQGHYLGLFPGKSHIYFTVELL